MSEIKDMLRQLVLSELREVIKEIVSGPTPTPAVEAAPVVVLTPPLPGVPPPGRGKGAGRYIAPLDADGDRVAVENRPGVPPRKLKRLYVYNTPLICLQCGKPYLAGRHEPPGEPTFCHVPCTSSSWQKLIAAGALDEKQKERLRELQEAKRTAEAQLKAAEASQKVEASQKTKPVVLVKGDSLSGGRGNA